MPDGHARPSRAAKLRSPFWPVAPTHGHYLRTGIINGWIKGSVVGWTIFALVWWLA